MKRGYLYILFLFFEFAVSCASEDANPGFDDLSVFQLGEAARSIVVKPRIGCEGDVNSCFTARFDKMNRIKAITYYYPDGRLKSKSVYEYDNHFGKVSRMTLFDADGVQSGVYNYSYDMVGNMVSCCLTGMNSQELNRWEHIYADDRVVHTDFYLEGELYMVTDNQWDDMLRIETVKDAEGVGIGTTTYNYHDMRRIASIESSELSMSIVYDEETDLPSICYGVQISPKGDFYWDNSSDESAPHEYVYEFDRKGNWVRRTELNLNDGTVVSIVTRKIRY